MPDPTTRRDVLWGRGAERLRPTGTRRLESNLIKQGDKVTVVVNPVRSGEHSGIFRSLTLADGRTFLERPARLGHGESK